MKGRNLGVEGFRGILILWIALFHYTYQYNEINYGKQVVFDYTFDSGGFLGVLIFYMISGYFLYDSTIREDVVWDYRKCVVFSIKKYWRLWPAYAISLLFIYSFLMSFELPERFYPQKSFENLIVNFFFIYHPGFDYIDGAHWFIAYLIVVQTTIIPFMLLQKKTRIWLFLFLSIVVTFLKTQHLGTSTELYLRAFSGFTCGGCLCELQHIYSNDKAFFFAIPLIILIWNLRIPLYLIIGVLFFLFLLSNRHSIISRLMGNRYFVFLGQQSFFWYLLHQKIGYGIMFLLIPNNSSNMLYLLLPLCFTFLLSVLVRFIVKKIKVDCLLNSLPFFENDKK